MPDSFWNVSNELGLDGLLEPDDLLGTEEYELLKNAAMDFSRAYEQDREARDVARGMDLETIARLRDVADGRVPSLSEALMRKTIQQNADQALGLASTLGGASNPGEAMRAGLEARQATGLRSNAEIEALKAREMDAARALLAEATGRGRATDVAGAVATGNTAAGLAASPFSALSGEKAADAAREAAILQAGGTAISGLGKGGNEVPNKYTTYDPFAPSDISLKENIQPAPEMADAFLRGLNRGPAPSAADPRSVENFLSTLRPQSFEYKAPDGVNKPPGQRMGVMAQDLPDHDVVTGPDGKKWISATVISDVLAGMGRLNEKIEGRGKRTRQQSSGAISGEAPQEVMIPQSAVHDYLAGLGITP